MQFHDDDMVAFMDDWSLRPFGGLNYVVVSEVGADAEPGCHQRVGVPFAAAITVCDEGSAVVVGFALVLAGDADLVSFDCPAVFSVCEIFPLVEVDGDDWFA